MITFYFDEKSKEPMYVQLYQHIKEQITSGDLFANQKLPSKRKLSSHLRVSPITVDTAYQQLVAEGYIRSVERSGFYVEEYIPVLTSLPQSVVIKKTQKEIPIKQAKYEFKTNMVDTSLFPNGTWAKLAREVLSENHYEMLNVTHPQGLRLLRDEIAQFIYQYRGIQVVPEQIVVGSGVENMIGIIIQLFGRMNHYAIENPGYGKLVRILKGNDVKTSHIFLDDAGLNVDELRHSNANIVLVTPSHQFPLGVVMPMKRRYELLQWVNESEEHFIIEDDYDSEFRFTGQPIPALQGLDHHEKVLYMNTFTKSLAPSFRISYLVLPLALLEKYQQILSYNSCTVPNFEQYILYKFIKGGYFERHINRMRNAYKAKMEVIVETIRSSSLSKHITLKGADAGLHVLMQVDLEMTEEELVEKAKQMDVVVYSLSSYYSKVPAIPRKPTLVVGYSGLSIKDTKQALELLFQAWTKKTPTIL